jgi:hypothetical protein
MGVISQIPFGNASCVSIVVVEYVKQGFLRGILITLEGPEHGPMAPEGGSWRAPDLRQVIREGAKEKNKRRGGFSSSIDDN